jgi:hypothetical protein
VAKLPNITAKKKALAAIGPLLSSKGKVGILRKRTRTKVGGSENIKGGKPSRG